MTGKKKFPPMTIPAIVSIVMLFAGIPKFFPYGYYTLLRFVVCGTAAYVVFFSLEEEKKYITFPAGFLAILFNPIIPIHLSKEAWVIIDFVTAVFFAISIFSLRVDTLEVDEEIDPNKLKL